MALEGRDQLPVEEHVLQAVELAAREVAPDGSQARLARSLEVEFCARTRCDFAARDLRARGVVGELHDPGAAGQSFQALLGSASERFQPVQTRSDEAAMLIYTSGTTGPPKGALNGHRCLLGNLPGFELSQNFYPREQDLMWTPADWAWTGGLRDARRPALHYGVPGLGHVG